MIRKFYNRASFWACAMGLLLGAAGMSLTGAAAEPTAPADESAALKIGLLLGLEQRFGGGLQGQAAGVRARDQAYQRRRRRVRLARQGRGRRRHGGPPRRARSSSTASSWKSKACIAIVGPQRQRQRTLPVAEAGDRSRAAIPTVQLLGPRRRSLLRRRRTNDFLFRTALSDVSPRVPSSPASRASGALTM